MDERFIRRSFLFLLALSLLLVLPSFASAEKIHDAWHYSGDTFTVKGDVYMLTHYDFYDSSVLLTVNNVTYIIDEDECKLTASAEYCIEEIFRNRYNATSSDPIKYEDGVVYAGIHLVVNTRGPSISITRTYSKTNPELNEEVDVDVVVKNTGTEGTDSFFFQDTYPAGAVITSSSSGIQKTSKSVTYSSNVDSNSQKTFSYSFIVTEYTEFSSQVKASFTYGGQAANISVSGQTIKVLKPYDFTASISPDNLEAGQQATLSIKITNKVSKDITVNQLKVAVLSLLSVQTSPGELQKKNNDYVWNGTIATDKYVQLSLLLKPTKSGTYILPVSLFITDSDGKEFSEKKNTSLTGSLVPIETILTLGDSSVSGGSNFRVAFSVKNPNKYIGFKNIRATIKSELFPDFKLELSDLMTGSTQTLFSNDSLVAPYVEEKKTFDINVSGSYDTSTGEKLLFTKKLPLTVTHVDQAITLIQEIDKAKASTYDNITVTVKVQNNNAEAIEVDVHDEYTLGLTLVGGKASATLLFENAETKTAYTYKLNVPSSYTQNESIIKTLASIRSKDFSTQKTATVQINVTVPKESPGEQQQQQNQSQAQPEPEKKPELKQGFIERVISSISSFFKRLFGKD
jgi:hypothetical protein